MSSSGEPGLFGHGADGCAGWKWPRTECLCLVSWWPSSEWGLLTSRLSMELQRGVVPRCPPCEAEGETNGDVAPLPINCDQKGTTLVSKLLA